MKLRLPKQLCAALVAATLLPTAMATTLSDAYLQIDSFNETTLSQSGWTFSGFSTVNDGVFTSGSQAATISRTDGSSIATLSGGRHVWSAVFTVNAADVDNNTAFVRLLMGANEGIGMDASNVFGAYTNTTKYGTFSKSQLQDNGNGTYTFGVSYRSNNDGTAVFSQGVQAVGTTLRDGSNATGIKLADVEGISYTNLYWFKNVLSEADMKWVLQEAGSDTVFTWNGTAADSAWNTTNTAWKVGDTAATFVATAESGQKNSVIFDDSAASKTVNISENITMAGGAKIAASGYTFNISNNAVVSLSVLSKDASVTDTTFNVSTGSTLLFDGNGINDSKLVGGGRVQQTQNFSGDFTYTGDASEFTGTLAVKRDESGHGGPGSGGGIVLSDSFAGVVEVKGRFFANNLSLGNAQKLVLDTDGVTNTTGFWSNAAVTLDKKLDIIGSGRADLFLSYNVTLAQNLTAEASTTLGIKNGAKLILQGEDNRIGNLSIDSGKVQVEENAKLTFVNTLNGGSKSLTNVIGTGTIALTEKHGIASAGGSYTNVTLDNAFTGTLHYQGGLQYDSNLGGASKVVFGGTSNICFNSSANETHTFSKNIELDDNAILGLSIWGNATTTSSNILSGSIKGGADTTIRKVDGGALTLSGDLSQFHGTFELQEGTHGLTIETAQNLTTDATFTGGIRLRKTGSATLTLSGDMSEFTGDIEVAGGTLALSVANGQTKTLTNNISGNKTSFTATGEGTLSLEGGTIGGSTELNLRNEQSGDAARFILDGVTLAGRVNIKGSRTTIFQNGSTTTATSGFSLVADSNVVLKGADDGGKAAYNWAGTDIAIHTDKTLTLESGAELTATGFLYSGAGSKYGYLAIDDGAGVTVNGCLRLQGVTNNGKLELTNTNEKTVGAYSQGSTGVLKMHGGVSMTTDMADGGTVAGSYDLGAGAALHIKALGDSVSANVENLTLATNAVMGVYQGSDVTATSSNEAAMSVSGTLTAGSGATLNANLTMQGGSTIAVDYANGGLHMGSSVTFAGGEKMNLSDDIINGLNSLTVGSGLTLFSGVDSFTIGGEDYNVNKTYTASNYFNLAGVNTPSDFVIKYGNDSDNLLRDSGSGQSIFIWREMPEPATATLSLLALAGLTARRRRK